MKRLFNRNEYEDTTLKDNPSDWMAEEIRRESKVSAWDLDNRKDLFGEAHYTSYEQQRAEYEEDDHSDHMNDYQTQRPVRRNAGSNNPGMVAQRIIGVIFLIYFMIFFIFGILQVLF